MVIGEEANHADEASFLKLSNWKMLLGKSTAELEAEKTTNSDLARLLHTTTLHEVALQYFREMLQKTLGSEPEIQDKPQTIIGIPPSASQDQKRWRQTYKRRIERIFEQLGYPKPRFWPEPFAVFQYHLNLVEIRDIGSRQNVLVIDVGGATTNVCLIQTTQHGRLARGGVNHVPHGVKSTEVGGATLDVCIAQELGLDGPVSQIERYIKPAKEQLSAVQRDWDQESLGNSTSFDWNGRQVELSAALVKETFVGKVWPAISATIQESLEEVDSKGVLVQRVHIVIMAGGTCQMELTQRLIRDKLCQSRKFTETRFILSSSYRDAVAHGLAIEAAANSRHHDMMPSRVSAYLQEDLKFECGHSGASLYVPHKLKSDYESQGDLPNGVLLKAPRELGAMVSKPRTWEFRLKQNTRDFYYRFSKLSDADHDEELLRNWKRIARTGEARPGRQMVLGMTLQDDGFAKLAVDTTDQLSFELEPIDLHDLSELVGDTFFAVDFGTDNTQVAYVNVKDPDLLQPLPSSYIWDPQTEKRARDLVVRIEEALGETAQRGERISALNEKALTEYVYHSNRIEGSLLDRGETERVLETSGSTERETRAGVMDGLGSLGIIDEQGQILKAPMIIRDTLAAVDLRDAFRFVERLGRDTRPFSGVVLREIHQLVMRSDEDASPGRFRRQNVAIAQTTFVPPEFVQVDPLVQEMLERFGSPEFNALPPILQAVEAHARFVSIHPFSDGNGRVARLLANYFMWKANLPGFLLPWENRERYYDALEECNSKEPGLWGNLTDLINLFCDVLEDSIGQMEEAGGLSESDVEGEETVVDDRRDDSEFGRLIAELKGSGRARPLNFLEQYEDWLNTMSAVISEIKELSGQLSRVFRTEWRGEVHVKDYPIIDMHGYRAIRARQGFAQTWALKVVLDFLDDQEELIFHFGPSSSLAEELNAGLRRTCSLHISRFSGELSRHVQVAHQDWSRVMEITHDGSSVGVVLRELAADQTGHFSDERARVENWFGMLIWDLLESRGG